MNKRAKKKKQNTLGEALMKVATGYSVEEVTEEYAEVDGEMKLLKRKETKKDVPPDLKAVQILLAGQETDLTKLSDEELLAEKERLLKELAEKKE
ncbi:MAG: cytochrome P450 [Clostridiales bacterium]|nr:cytochrome P450 [Clostridiales bacterium]